VILGRGLDHEIDVRELVHVGRPGDAPEQRVALGGLQPAAFDRAQGGGLDPVAPPFDQLLARLEEDDGLPGPSHGLGDARAHQAAPDDPHRPNILCAHRPALSGGKRTIGGVPPRRRAFGRA
jgi:hypothetical protein